ncbi:hypothetical protein [Clostridium chromiireducens]|uniref:hypothetical protein n=1 Tax=Clostridium chromiireducens TaxID=225345 RepID=UPI001365FADB|nr:hypothetical protein [Clostridium chromiireducens]
MIKKGENKPELKIKVYKLNAYTKTITRRIYERKRKRFKFRKVGKDLLKGSFKLIIRKDVRSH